MLKKRFIGVITVKDGWAVQSFEYRRYLPIGHPAVIAENLDRWGVDEILVLAIDRSAKGLGPDFELLNMLSKLSLSTPVTYGGGVSNAVHASLVIQSGAERVSLDTILHSDISFIREISSHVGSQALVACLPLSLDDGQLMIYKHVTQTQTILDDGINRIFREGLVSEALVIDWHHDGMHKKFNSALLCTNLLPSIPLIAFGGLSDVSQIKDVLRLPNIVAVAIGNALNYSEHAVQRYKQQIASEDLRLPYFYG